MFFLMKKTSFLVLTGLVALSLLVTERAVAASPMVCTILTSTLNVGSADVSGRTSVTMLQDFLRAQNFLSAKSTGYFGPMTQKAVKNFQTSQKLPAVGNVGPMTRAAIQKISCATAPAITPAPAPTVTPAPQVQGTSTTAAPIPAPAPRATLPYQANTFPTWKGTWGSVTTTSSGTLRISATQGASGAEAIFPDGSEWTNYRYSASVIVSNGDITLISRYVDKDNFIGCTFNANWIGITERVNGVSRTVASATLPELSTSNFFPKYTSVAMRVSGKSIGCIEIGENDNLSYTLSDNSPLMKGTVGIETFGPGGATLELRDVRVVGI